MLNRKLCYAIWVCALALSATVRADNDTHAASNDQQITALVSAKLASADPGVARLISVSVQDGVVTLTGRVYSIGQAAKVVQEAQGVPGVLKVKNRLSLP